MTYDSGSPWVECMSNNFFFNEYIILLKKEKGRTHRKDMCTIPFQRIQIAKRESIKSTND